MQKLIKDVIHGYVSFDQELIDIINSAEFQRLKNVRQTSYSSIYPSSSHDRFTHSLGVYRLGVSAFENFHRNFMADYPEEKDVIIWEDVKRIFSKACLLHDVGHSPFSHTGEYFYLRKRADDGRFYIYKELSDIVDSETFSRQFNETVLAKREAKPHEIMSAIIGIRNWLHREKKEYQELFARMIIGLTYPDSSVMANGVYNVLICLLNSGVIDVDKLDYLLRDKMMTGFEGVNIDTERLLKSVCLVNKRNNTHHPEYCLGYYKNALSVIENVIIAHDAEKKWIQNNAVVAYDSFLIQKCIQAVESTFSKDTANSVFCEESLGVEGADFGGQKIRLLSDADIMYLAKQIPNESDYREYIDEYFNRGLRKKAICKSESEFDLMLRELGDDRRKIFMEWFGDLKDELSNGTDVTEKYFVINDKIKSKIVSDNLKKQNDSDIPDEDKKSADLLTQSILKKIEVFEKYAQENNIEFNFVITYFKRFDSNVSKLQQDEIIMKYRNFMYSKSIVDIISTYSLNKNSSIRGFSDVYYIYFKRGDTEISPQNFISDFVGLINEMI